MLFNYFCVGETFLFGVCTDILVTIVSVLKWNDVCAMLGIKAGELNFDYS
jgi:hypothetical protein